MASRQSSTIRTLWPPLAWMGVILLVSSIPGSPGPNRPSLEWLAPSVQDLLHVPVYAILSLLWCRSLHATGIGRWAVVAFALSISLAWAAFEELYQLAIPERYASWLDWTSDGLGAGLGVLLFLWWGRTASDRPGANDGARAQPR